MKLDGKNVVITGASSGIGLALLQMLLAKGCKVVAASRTIDKLNQSDLNLNRKPCDVSNRNKLMNYLILHWTR